MILLTSFSWSGNWPNIKATGWWFWYKHDNGIVRAVTIHYILWFTRLSYMAHPKFKLQNSCTLPTTCCLTATAGLGITLSSVHTPADFSEEEYRSRAAVMPVMYVFLTCDVMMVQICRWLISTLPSSFIVHVSIFSESGTLDNGITHCCWPSMGPLLCWVAVENSRWWSDFTACLFGLPHGHILTCWLASDRMMVLLIEG